MGAKKRIYDGFIAFWCKNDNDLKNGGCSDFIHNEYEQLSLF